MKKIHARLVVAALSGAVLTVSAGAAPYAVTVYQGGSAPMTSGYQISACESGLSQFFSNCPDAFLPNCPEAPLPGPAPELPGGGTLWPDETPGVPDSPPSDGDTALSGYEAEVIRLVNEARRENGLPALAASGEISRVARVKSQDMVENRYFSHTSPTYGTPFQMLTAFGVSYSTAGENIAYGQKTPQEVVHTWMNSPGHRANILNAAYTQIGVGYVAAGNYWTQLFVG